MNAPLHNRRAADRTAALALSQQADRANLERHVANEVQPPAGPWLALESAPTDGRQYIRVLTFEVFRWVPYKPNSNEFKRGQKGRWQKHTGYGFDNAELAGIGYQVLGNDGNPVVAGAAS